MAQSFAVDASIPVSKDVSRNDPAHPSNVVKGLLEVQNQAVADTKYDAFPPKRIYESFATQYNINTYLIIIVAALFILYGVYVSTLSAGRNSKQSFQFFFFVLIVMGGFLFATRFIRT
jgi:hypothetical protein